MASGRRPDQALFLCSCLIEQALKHVSFVLKFSFKCVSGKQNHHKILFQITHMWTKLKNVKNNWNSFFHHSFFFFYFLPVFPLHHRPDPNSDSI